MKTCKDCKWWELLPAKAHIGECDNFYANSRSGMGATTSNAMSMLLTGPDFGCVHWESRFAPDIRDLSDMKPEELAKLL